MKYKMDLDDPINKILYQYDNNLGPFEEFAPIIRKETMNDNLNTPTHADDALAPRLNDEDFAKLLATQPLDGKVLGPIDDTYVGYVTDADETADEATPTFH